MIKCCKQTRYIIPKQISNSECIGEMLKQCKHVVSTQPRKRHKQVCCEEYEANSKQT